jgi:gliding motility-associated protein GldM
MSIPKEPRQLMINLMYLVLTALLALNVSAEVMNAFFSLDKGLKNSRNIVESSNDKLLESINKQADAYKNPNNDKYRNNAKTALQIGADFVSYIENIRNDLMTKAQGPSDSDPTIPKDIRNKDITTNMFLNEGLAAQIKERIEKTRTDLLALADNDGTVSSSLPLIVEPIPPGVESKTWEEYKFKQMPVAAVWPTLGKMQTDAKTAVTAVLGYCAQKVGGTELKFDAFEPVAAAEKAYVISGEKYVADVFLSAYSTSAQGGVSISAGGQSLPVKDGKGRYEVTASGLGEKSYNVSINVKNPLTGEVKNYAKEFKYEVGQRSVAVQLDKMNVFYIGVTNPISVSAAGVSSSQVRVNGSGGGMSISSAGGAGKYNVTVTTPTNDAKITVSGGGVSQTFDYRVKRIPDPIAKVGNQLRGGTVGNGTFKAMTFMNAVLENFDFEAKCSITGFEFTYLAKRQDPSPPKTNGGERFGSDIMEMINKAKPGDAYFFDNIKARCPGDNNSRDLGSMSFKIK